MITEKIDTTLNTSKLENHMHEIRVDVLKQSQWLYREKYIDRGLLDPFYIIDCKYLSSDRGDDLLDEALFRTHIPSLKIKSLTRNTVSQSNNYWLPISSGKLIGRLENFMTMYHEDYLQPPGFFGDVYNPQQRHQRFEKKRFIYRISLPTKKLVAIGSKMFAELGKIGAVAGRVLDETGHPLNSAIVELVYKNKTISRNTNSEGLFWFSKISPGQYRYRVKNQSCFIQVFNEENFGNVNGQFYNQDGVPLDGAEIQLQAPDGEIYSAWSSATGQFSIGPLPAFPYITQLPGFLFTATISVTTNGLIGGKLLDPQGVLLTNKEIILKQNNVEILRKRTNEKGDFRFNNLAGGRYQIETPGYRLYSQNITGGRIDGQVDEKKSGLEIQLIAEQEVIAITHTINGQFHFDQLTSGLYHIRSKQNMLSKRGDA